jgi:hypothetical protein
MASLLPRPRDAANLAQNDLDAAASTRDDPVLGEFRPAAEQALLMNEFIFRASLAIGGMALATSLTGCLSLGGRTTYVQEKPETLGRITALETRVSALEQAYVRDPSCEVLPPIPATTGY